MPSVSANLAHTGRVSESVIIGALKNLLRWDLTDPVLLPYAQALKAATRIDLWSDCGSHFRNYSYLHGLAPALLKPKAPAAPILTRFALLHSEAS